MNIQLKLAWRYLWGRKLRTVLTMLAVVLGVALIFGLNGMLPSMIKAFEQSTLAAAGKVDLTVSGNTGNTFSLDVWRRIQRVPGVSVATPSLARAVALPRTGVVTGSGQVDIVTVNGIEPLTAGKVREYPVVSGRFLTPADSGAVLGTDLAAKLGVKVGDTLVLPSAVGTGRFPVVGLLDLPAVPGVEEIFVTLRAAQSLFGQAPDAVNTVDAKFDPGADRATVEAAVTRALGPDYRIGGIEGASQLLASIQVGQVAINMFGVMALAMGAFIILNTFRTGVAERRHDVGMLRAIGATRGTVIGTFIVESLFQGVIGTAIGLFGGWLIGLGMAAMLRPLAGQYLRFEIGGPEFPPGTWALAIVLGVGVSVAGALIPALSAGRVTPLEALRPQLGAVYERAAGKRAWVGAGAIVIALLMLATRESGAVFGGAFLFLIGIVLAAPAAITPLAAAFSNLIDIPFPDEGDIARSNLQRNPGRSAITASAIMVSLAIVIAMLGVMSAITAGFTGYLDKSLGADFIFLPQSLILSQGNIGSGPRLAEEIKRTPGIREVTSLRIAQSKVGASSVQVVGIDPKTYGDMASFEWGKGTTDAAIGQLGQGRTVIANGIYAAQLGISPGDRLVMETPTGPRTYRVVGVGSDYLNAKLSTVYVSQDSLARDFSVTNDLLLMADLTPGYDVTQVHSALSAVLKDYPEFTLWESAQWRAQQVQTLDSAMGFYYVLIGALSLPSLLALLNTLAMSVLARTREIGMLRAVGSTRRQIRRMVMAESVLLATIGTAFGIVAGTWLGYALVASMNSVGFPMPYVFPFQPVLVTIVVGVGFGVVAALIPARQAARLDVVQALHYE